MAALGVRLDERGRLGETIARENGKIQIAEGLFSQEFASATADTRFLAGLPALQAYLDHGGTERRDDLANILLVFTAEEKLYDKVRLIDASGQEIIRINLNDGKPQIVPARELQNKAARYFFGDSIALNRGEVYVSPLDLNVEHDRLEVPYKPTLRFGTPVFDAHGRKQGVVILNQLSSRLLQRFRDIYRSDNPSDNPEGFMLVNRDGYWLSGARRADEWGFMRGQADLSFAHDFPEEWRTIGSTEHGTLRSKRGLFVYDTFRPLQESQRTSSGSVQPLVASQRELMANEYQWKIISLTPVAVLAGEGRTGEWLILAMAYFLLAVATWIAVQFSMSRRQARSELLEEEARLREIAETMSEGLLVTDANGVISFSNPRASRLLGYTGGELRGADLHELLHVHSDGTPSPREECRVLQVMHSGVSDRAIEETFRRKDGTLVSVETNVSVISRNQGRVGSISTFRDVTEVKELQARLRDQALRDAMTGLFNRRYFEETLARELAQAVRYNHPLSVVMADIDHFKSVNDTYGHQAGDEALKTFADLMKHNTRGSDLACRYGGEEFMLLLANTPRSGAHACAEQLRLALAQSSVPWSTSTICMTASFGVASFPEDAATAEQLIAAADAALYAAKSAGRNRVCEAAATSEHE